jgi:hypothetical protein
LERLKHLLTWADPSKTAMVALATAAGAAVCWLVPTRAVAFLLVANRLAKGYLHRSPPLPPLPGPVRLGGAAAALSALLLLAGFGGKGSARAVFGAAGNGGWLCVGAALVALHRRRAYQKSQLARRRGGGGPPPRKSLSARALVWLLNLAGSLPTAAVLRDM